MNPFLGYEDLLARWRETGSGAAAAGFRDALEPRIRPLVLYLVERVGLLTFSSCEGHLPTEASPFRPAHVGILPYVSAAAAPGAAARRAGAVALCLVAAAHQTMRALDRPAVGVCAMQGVLHTEVGERTCLDVWFVPAHGTHEAYFDGLPRVIAAYQRQLAVLLASGETAARTLELETQARRSLRRAH